jgi:hypothetical protein
LLSCCRSPLLLRGPSKARAWSQILAAAELRLRLDALVAHYGQLSNPSCAGAATKPQNTSETTTGGGTETVSNTTTLGSHMVQGDPVQRAFIAGVSDVLSGHTSLLQQLSQELCQTSAAAPAGAEISAGKAAGKHTIGGLQHSSAMTLLGVALWVGRSLKPHLSLLAALCRCTPIDPRGAVLGRHAFSAGECELLGAGTRSPNIKGVL